MSSFPCLVRGWLGVGCMGRWWVASGFGGGCVGGAVWLGISLRCSAVVLGLCCDGAGGRRGAGLGVVPGCEAGGPVALAVEGFGRAGGDLGGPGEDLGEQVQQVGSFVAGEGGQDAALDGADAGEQLVGGGAAVGGDLDEDAAPVGGVGDAADPAAAFEQVEGGGHGGGGDQDPVADLRGGERGACPVDDGQRRRGGLRDAEGRGDVPVELAQQGLAGAAQGRVGLGAGGIAAGVLAGEIGVYLDDAE